MIVCPHLNQWHSHFKETLVVQGQREPLIGHSVFFLFAFHNWYKTDLLSKETDISTTRDSGWSGKCGIAHLRVEDPMWQSHDQISESYSSPNSEWKLQIKSRCRFLTYSCSLELFLGLTIVSLHISKPRLLDIDATTLLYSPLEELKPSQYELLAFLSLWCAFHTTLTAMPK